MARSIALSLLTSLVLTLAPPAAPAQSDPVAPFLGTWCAQGDPAKQASIVSNGVYVTLTNESGSTSIGRATAGRQIVADEWNFVSGTLSSDGKTISWTNGTFWTRCHSHQRVDLQGRWYMGGDRSKPCYIDQSGTSLSLRNEVGQTATGSFVSRRTISTVWAGTTITGKISRDSTQILWSNGTYWTRSRR
jgi:hypothetical protein